MGEKHQTPQSYPTAWYCVDEDGYVAVFDILDYGPMPKSEYLDTQTSVTELFWKTFTVDEGNRIRFLNLKPEQIKRILLPFDLEIESKKWNHDQEMISFEKWCEVIIKIDMSKLDIFMKALIIDGDKYNHAVCLSKEEGLFFVDFCYKEKGIDLLERNKVVLERYHAPLYNPLLYISNDDVEDEEEEIYSDEMKEDFIRHNKFPFYIYRQGYNPKCKAAVKMNNPKYPLMIDQLPDELQKDVYHMPVHFNQKDKIQLAQYLPVSIPVFIHYVLYNKKKWAILRMEDGSYGYYNEKQNKLMTEDEMEPLLDSGMAVEYYDEDAERWD